MRNYLRFIFILFITAGIFFYLFSKVNFTSFISVLQKVKFSYLTMALIISVVCNLFVSAERWAIVLRKLGCRITLKESLVVKMGANFIVTILPLKSGEFSRMLYLKRLKDIPYAKSMLSILVEYCLNLAAVLSFFVLGVIVYFFPKEWIILNSNIRHSFNNFMILSLLNSRKYEDFRNNLIKIWQTLFKVYPKELAQLLQDKMIILYTIILISSALVSFYLLSKSLHIEIPIYLVLINVPLVVLLSHLPISFAGIGTNELAILILFDDYGSPEKLLSLGMLYTFVEYLLPLLISSFYTGIFTDRIFSKIK